MSIKSFLLSVLLVVSLINTISIVQAQQPTLGLKAIAELLNSGGLIVGNATFTQQSDGVRIMVQVGNLTAGRHGIHIHTVGRCDPPSFTTAGGHFNPENRKHGLQNPNGTHAGDLPNIEIADNGLGSLDVVSPAVTLVPGARDSLFKPNGTALVIHVNPDDQVTDPSGNSGPRVACGVVVATWETINVLDSIVNQTLGQKQSEINNLRTIIGQQDTQIISLSQQILQSNIIAAVAVGIAIVAIIIAAARSRPKERAAPATTPA